MLGQGHNIEAEDQASTQAWTRSQLECILDSAILALSATHLPPSIAPPLFFLASAPFLISLSEGLE